jgi:hypothetical protein
MGNKFDYQNMLNKISSEKISRNKTPQFTNAQIDAWNNAIELCHHIVEGRRSKFEPSENSLHKHIVNGSALLKDVLNSQQEIISSPIRFNGVSNEDIKRIFAEHGIKYEQPF